MFIETPGFLKNFFHENQMFFKRQSKLFFESQGKQKFQTTKHLKSLNDEDPAKNFW